MIASLAPLLVAMAFLAAIVWVAFWTDSKREAVPRYGLR